MPTEELLLRHPKQSSFCGCVSTFTQLHSNSAQLSTETQQRTGCIPVAQLQGQSGVVETRGSCSECFSLERVLSVPVPDGEQSRHCERKGSQQHPPSTPTQCPATFGQLITTFGLGKKRNALTFVTAATSFLTTQRSCVNFHI